MGASLGGTVTGDGLVHPPIRMDRLNTLGREPSRVSLRRANWTTSTLAPSMRPANHWPRDPEEGDMRVAATVSATTMMLCAALAWSPPARSENEELVGEIRKLDARESAIDAYVYGYPLV